MLMAFQPEVDLSCPICQDVFKDPVLLLCSHSFCKLCLRSWWTEKPTKECPVCKRRSSQIDPPCNLVLKNLCEAFTKQRKNFFSQEDVCRLHSERNKLFCLTDQQPVCVVCRDSAAHRNHQFKPIDEVTKDLKEKLQKSLKPLKDKLQRVNQVKKELEEAVDHIKHQSRHTERQIQDQFKKLHQFLLEEEEARMKALREEEVLKTQRMKDKMAAVSREIEALSETIRATEEQLRAADVCFLLKYKTTVERVQRCPLLEETQLGPGALIDQAKHLGNLAFNIWTNMKRLVQYTPVILDPNTAGHHLVLSDDLTSFRFGNKQQICSNPESFMDFPAVLGSEAFDSGSHSWDVHVGDSTQWMLGVMRNDGETGCWSISFLNGEFTAMNIDKKKVPALKVKSNPQKITVHLDCNKHKLSFKDTETNTRIHSFTLIHQSKFLPIFVTHNQGHISILPQQI